MGNLGWEDKKKKSGKKKNQKFDKRLVDRIKNKKITTEDLISEEDFVCEECEDEGCELCEDVVIDDFPENEDDEIDEAKMLWDNQISSLKQVIGSV